MICTVDSDLISPEDDTSKIIAEAVVLKAEADLVKFVPEIMLVVKKKVFEKIKKKSD